MALPKEKQPQAPRQKADRTAVPNWNRHGDGVATIESYVHNACRERPGFHRGARIK